MKTKTEITKNKIQYNNDSNKLTRGRKMKYFSIMFTVMVAALIARSEEPVTGWSFDQSTQQAFYLLENITIDGLIVEGDGSGEDDGECYASGTCDVIGAFRRGVCSDPAQQSSELLCTVLGNDWNTDEEICIGWRYADSEGATTVPLMGKEGAEGDNTFTYANPGESAYLKVYDASTGSILDLTPSAELPGWELNAIETIAGTSTANNTFGCTDASACNYDADAEVNDGSCLENDCAGDCGGSAELDNCGVCGGDGSSDQGCGCGQGAPSGCDNECGSTLENDACGECGGDNSSCSGCTNSDADNYDSNNLIDDGSCEYTVPSATNLTAEAGPARVLLSWDAPADDFSSSAGYTYDIYMDGEYTKSSSQTDTQIAGLDQEQVCFTVLANHNSYGASDDMSNAACATPDASVGGPCWRIQLTADLNGYGQFPVTDDQNWLGTADDATWGYDEEHDIIEPIHPPGNWVSLYFPHDEWSANAYNDINFTEDIVNSNHYFHLHNLTRWDFEVISNMPGPASVTFDWDNPEDGCMMQPEYRFYVLTDLTDDNVDDPHYHEISDGESLSFYLGNNEGLEQAKQNFSMFIGNIVPQAPANLSVDGGDRDMNLNWDDDTCTDLDDIRCRYKAESYNVYRDGIPTGDNFTSGDPGGTHFTRTHYAGGSGLGDASLLSESGTYLNNDTGGGVGVGQDNSDYYDNNDSNPNPAADCASDDGLLYESYYYYTVTSSNKAGESSEGHVIRPSGSDNDNTYNSLESISDASIPNMDDDQWNAGRLSQSSDWTDRNTNPTSIDAHDGATDDNGEHTIVIEDGGAPADESGVYRIPHNSDPDSNSITPCVEGHESNDHDETDGAASSGDTDNEGDPWVRLWTQTAGGGSGILGDPTESIICFSDNNPYAAQGADEVDRSYTFNQNITDTYPVKSQTLDADGNWRELSTAEMEANAGTYFPGSYSSMAEAGSCGVNHHQDDEEITVVIKPEPNRAPVASSAFDLIEPGDGLSDHDMNYDEVDPETGDCIYHQLEGEWACDYGDTDNDFDAETITWVEPHDGIPGVFQDGSDDGLAHLWFRAEDSYDPDNRNYGGDWTGANDGFHSDEDEISYQWFEADGIDDMGDVWDDWDGDGEIDPGELTYDDEDLGTDSYPGDGFTDITASSASGYHNINLDITRAVQEDSPSARLLTMVVTDEYGYSASSTLVVQVTGETNDTPTAGQLDSYLDTDGIDQYWIVEYMDDNKETEVRSHHAADVDDDDLNYWWTYDSGTGGVYNRSADNRDDDMELVEGSSILDSRYNFLDYNNPDVENFTGDTETENSDVDLWRDLVLDLNVGTHVFTFHAEDNYSASASTSISIQVDNEPPAATPEIEIVHEDLRYVTVDVRESEYIPSETGNHIWGGPGEGGSIDDLGELTDNYFEIEYNGSTWNTAQLDLYRGDELLHTWNDVNEPENEGIDSGERRYVDSPDGGGLAPSSDYTYTVEARNSDRNAAADSENSADARTGDRPTVIVLTPNGGTMPDINDGSESGEPFEILTIGDIFDVDFTTTDKQYISRVEVYYSRDGGTTWNYGTDNDEECDGEVWGPYEDQNPACYHPGEAQSVTDEWVDDGDGNDYDTDPDGYDTNDEHDDNSDDWNASQDASNGCGGENGFDDDPDSGNGSDCCVGCVNGDGVDDSPDNPTINFGISDNADSNSQDDDITNQAMVKVRVYDKGDYYGQGVDSNEDASDNVFTMADHKLHKDLLSGWHLWGPALEQYDNHMSVGITGSGGESSGTDDGSWWSDLGNSLYDWGSNWVAYYADGTYDNIYSYQGIGYYLALASEETMVLQGTAYATDPDASGTSGQPRASDLYTCPEGDCGAQVNEWNLVKGWNLVSNPLVVMVSKYRLDIYEVDGDGEKRSFDEAVNSGWIAPSIYGLFENSYEPYVRLLPFGGYWVNTSRELRVEIHPLYLDADGNDLSRERDIAMSLKLNARDISGDGLNDFIIVGLSENADNKFVYGEDEYDLPRSAYAALGGEFINMKVGSNLMKDMKSAEYEDYQDWTISIENEKVDNDIELSWGDVSGFTDDLHMIINGEAINMHEEHIIVINSMIEEVAIVVGNVDSYLNPIPVEFGLSAAYPNPFNPTTTLGLALNVDSFVSMSVFNIRGQVVEVLVDRNMKAGYHNVAWNADGISSGMYFVRVETGANTAMQKLMLLK